MLQGKEIEHGIYRLKILGIMFVSVMCFTVGILAGWLFFSDADRDCDCPPVVEKACPETSASNTPAPLPERTTRTAPEQTLRKSRLTKKTAPAPDRPRKASRRTRRPEPRPAPSAPAPKAVPPAPPETAPHDEALPPDPVAEDDPDEWIWEPTREGIKEAFLERREEVRFCYESWLEQNPDLAGRLEIVLNVPFELGEGDTDETRRIQITLGESEFDNSFFEGCVAGVLSGIRFAPPAERDIQARIPIVFGSAEKED